MAWRSSSPRSTGTASRSPSYWPGPRSPSNSSGGICLALGLLTRVWGALATTQFLLIVAKVKWDVGVFSAGGRSGFEIDLMYAATAAALLLAGPGLLALDHLLGLETNPAAEPATTDRERVRSDT